MALDPKQIAEWKALAEAADPESDALRDDVLMTDAQQALWGVAREAVPALIAEVERLRGEVVKVRDPADKPERWVSITVHAADPEQKARTVAWLRRADEARDVLREVERLRGALRGILATEMGYEWDGTGGPEERAIQRARAVLPPK